MTVADKTAQTDGNENMEESLELDALLDDNLEDIPDLPSYVTPPTGYYAMDITKVEAVTAGDKPAVRITCVITDTLELADEADSDSIVANGSLWSKLYFPLLNAESKQYMKRDLLQALVGIGATSLRDVQQLEGRAVLATIKRRHGKKGSPQAKELYTDWSGVTLDDGTRGGITG